MHTKEELTEKLENEIRRFVRSSSEISTDSSYIKQLHVMTGVKKELDAMPLHDIQIEMLMGKEDVLQSAYEHWQELDPRECGFDKDDFYGLTNDFLEDENYRYKDTLLYDKVSAEYQSLVNELSKKAPQQIIEGAYEVTAKSDILLLLAESVLEQRQVDILLAMEHPLDSLYHDWQDCECSYMDMLRDTVISSIDDYGKKLERHSLDHDKPVPEYMEDFEIRATDQEPEDVEDLER